MLLYKYKEVQDMIDILNLIHKMYLENELSIKEYSHMIKLTQERTRQC